jgi:hypothetical protein
VVALVLALDRAVDGCGHGGERELGGDTVSS